MGEKKNNKQEGEGDPPWAKGQEHVAQRVAQLESSATKMGHRKYLPNAGITGMCHPTWLHLVLMSSLKIASNIATFGGLVRVSDMPTDISCPTLQHV